MDSPLTSHPSTTHVSSDVASTNSVTSSWSPSLLISLLARIIAIYISCVATEEKSSNLCSNYPMVAPAKTPSSALCKPYIPMRFPLAWRCTLLRLSKIYLDCTSPSMARKCVELILEGTEKVATSSRLRSTNTL